MPSSEAVVGGHEGAVHDLSNAPSIDHDFAATMRRVGSIDLMLQRQLRIQQRRFDAGVYGMLGLVISTEEVEALLQEPVGFPTWASQTKDCMIARPAFEPRTRLGRIRSAFSLSDDEIDILLFAMLPHFDARYGTLFGFMQDDVKRRLPAIDLVLNALSESFEGKLALEAALLPSAPLVRYGLVRIGRPGDEHAGQWNQSSLSTDVDLFHHLAGQFYLPAELAAGVKRLTTRAEALFSVRDEKEIVAAGFVTHDGRAFPLVGIGGADEGDRISAHAVAAEHSGYSVLTVDLPRLLSDRSSLQHRVAGLFRTAILQHSCLMLTRIEETGEGIEDSLAILADYIGDGRVPTAYLLASDRPAAAFRACLQQFVAVSPCPASVRSAALEAAISNIDPNHDIDVVAVIARFAVPLDEIDSVVREAQLVSQRRDDGHQGLATEDLVHVLKYRARQDFGPLANRRTPSRSRQDLLLPAALGEQLDEIVSAMTNRQTVLDAGFRSKLGYGFGVSALFHGASGAGKTLAAEVLANELGVDLIQVNLANIMDKYVGETEKNLARIFDIATLDNGLLFFDEADALFGKRTEVKDAHDRHANIEVSYLLQRLESYPGLVILASNNRGHLDHAFTRRLTFMIRFQQPDAELREALWRSAWPAQVKLAEDIDYGALAERYEFTGGNIRNVALLATWLAYAEGGTVCLRNVTRAAEREMAKAGHLAMR
ncbi:MAG: ATP-binding protein [Actinobacteria bacterium]|nr:ATP-binding protein [Actinomycetota bacterium]